MVSVVQFSDIPPDYCFVFFSTIYPCNWVHFHWFWIIYLWYNILCRARASNPTQFIWNNFPIDLSWILVQGLPDRLVLESQNEPILTDILAVHLRIFLWWPRVDSLQQLRVFIRLCLTNWGGTSPWPHLVLCHTMYNPIWVICQLAFSLFVPLFRLWAGACSVSRNSWCCSLVAQGYKQVLLEPTGIAVLHNTLLQIRNQIWNHLMLCHPWAVYFNFLYPFMCGLVLLTKFIIGNEHVNIAHFETLAFSSWGGQPQAQLYVNWHLVAIKQIAFNRHQSVLFSSSRGYSIVAVPLVYQIFDALVQFQLKQCGCQTTSFRLVSIAFCSELGSTCFFKSVETGS